MNSARWDTELLFPHALGLLEIVCYPLCEAELSCSVISSSFPKLFIFFNRPQKPSAPSPKLFCSKQSCAEAAVALQWGKISTDLLCHGKCCGLRWVPCAPRASQGPGCAGKGEVFLWGTEHFLPKAFTRESPMTPCGSRAGLLQVVNVFYFLQAVSLMKV